jgi:hypothetical protein
MEVTKSFNVIITTTRVEMVVAPNMNVVRGRVLTKSTTNLGRGLGRVFTGRNLSRSLKCADLDEMPSSLGLGIYLKLLCLPSPGESFPCYFNLNGVFIATHFETIQNMGFLTQHRRRPPIPFHILF